ncbi:MAG: amidohydrolase family protein [Rhodospirillaceae bacterium]|nr:amidohydrolase family protein [Rhodospirillaceae bacterium]
MSAKQLTVDCHVHYVPDCVADILRQRRSAPYIEQLEGGAEVRHMPAGNVLSFGADYTDMAARIPYMDGHGIDIQILSMGLLFGLHALPAEEAVPIARAFNDDLAELCATGNDRFKGLALLPIDDIGACVTEWKRARTELGLLGAIVPTNGFVTREHADHMAPIFAAAQETGGHIFVHPGPRPEELGRGGTLGAADPLALERAALGVQARLGQAMVTLNFSDYLEPFPDVTVQVANLGGTLPMVIERMDHTYQSRKPDAVPPSKKLGRCYVDCASLGPAAIDIAATVFGADKILLGTDYPIFGTEQALKAVHGSSLAEADKAKLLGGNALEMIS